MRFAARRGRIVPSLPSLPIQPLQHTSADEYSLFRDLADYPWVLPLYRYGSTEELLAALEEKVIAPAATRALEIEKRQKELQVEINSLQR